MSSITIQVPKRLADRLRPYREQLPRILELGLTQLESVVKSELSGRERTIQVLQSSGLIRPIDPAILSRRRRPRRRQKPLNIPGKPLSEIIIEQRGKL